MDPYRRYRPVSTNWESSAPKERREMTYGERWDADLKNAEKIGTDGIGNIVFGVLGGIGGIILIFAGAGTLGFSTHAWIGISLLVGGIFLTLFGSGQFLIGSVQMTAGVYGTVLSPLTAIDTRERAHT